MRYLIPVVLAGVLAWAGPAAAQPVQDPNALVNSWYEEYLGRPADLAGLAGWVGDLQGGRSPAFVLAGILGSDEYYQRVGNDPADFIRALFLDVVGRQPTPREIRYWVGRMNTEPRTQLALDALRTYGMPQQAYSYAKYFQGGANYYPAYQGGENYYPAYQGDNYYGPYYGDHDRDRYRHDRGRH